MDSKSDQPKAKVSLYCILHEMYCRTYLLIEHPLLKTCNNCLCYLCSAHMLLIIFSVILDTNYFQLKKIKDYG